MNLLLLAGLALVALGPPVPVTIRYSHYWPALGGANCSKFVNGECVSRMASGERWQDWTGQACACPPEYPFWTVIELDGKQWVCLDRGGKIKYPYVDFLERYPRYGHGTEVEALVTLFELEVPTLDDLSASKVDHTNADYNVSPVLEADRLQYVPKASKDGIQPSADKDASQYSNIPLDSGNRYPYLVLYEALDSLEELSDEGPLQEPIDAYHRQGVLNQKHQCHAQ